MTDGIDMLLLNVSVIKRLHLRLMSATASLQAQLSSEHLFDRLQFIERACGFFDQSVFNYFAFFGFVVSVHRRILHLYLFSSNRIVFDWCTYIVTRLRDENVSISTHSYISVPSTRRSSKPRPSRRCDAGDIFGTSRGQAEDILFLS